MLGGLEIGGREGPRPVTSRGNSADAWAGRDDSCMRKVTSCFRDCCNNDEKELALGQNRQGKTTLKLRSDVKWLAVGLFFLTWFSIYLSILTYGGLIVSKLDFSNVIMCGISTPAATNCLDEKCTILAGSLLLLGLIGMFLFMFLSVLSFSLRTKLREEYLEEYLNKQKQEQQLVESRNRRGGIDKTYDPTARSPNSADNNQSNNSAENDDERIAAVHSRGSGLGQQFTTSDILQRRWSADISSDARRRRPQLVTSPSSLRQADLEAPERTSSSTSFAPNVVVAEDQVQMDTPVSPDLEQQQQQQQQQQLQQQPKLRQEVDSELSGLDKHDSRTKISKDAHFKMEYHIKGGRYVVHPFVCCGNLQWFFKPCPSLYVDPSSFYIKLGKDRAVDPTCIVSWSSVGAQCCMFPYFIVIIFCTATVVASTNPKSFGFESGVCEIKGGNSSAIVGPGALQHEKNGVQLAWFAILFTWIVLLLMGMISMTSSAFKKFRAQRHAQ